MSKRYDGDESKKDLHERNLSYLADCAESAAFSAQRLNWSVVNCVENSQLRSRDDISTEILKLIKEKLNL